MHDLINLIARVTSWEVAFGVAVSICMTLFLAPVYILNCTGRNLLANNIGRLAHREWMLGRVVVVYSRWPISMGRSVKKSHRWCQITFGTLQLGLTRLSGSQAPMYRATYKNAKKA